MRSLRLLTIIVILTMLNTVAQGRILNVPEDYETIQVGIDAAEAGDTVLVQPGRYEENVVINGTGLSIASLILTTGDSAYIDSTIIDGGGQGSTVSFDRHENILLRGFTITNGTGSGRWRSGGGIYAHGNPTFEDLLITDNHSSEGGGVFSSSGSPTLTRVRINSNVSNDFGGGGYFVGNGSPIFNNCTIKNNQARNVAGIEFRECDPILNHVSIVSNAASGMIGGVAFFGGGNRNPVLFDHVTIAGNRSAERLWSGGIHMASVGLGLRLINSIVFNNDGNHEIVQYDGDDGGEDCHLSVEYSDIEEGEEGIWVVGISEMDWLEGNILENPLFVDPDNGDYHLSADSPCIDAGEPDGEPDPDGSRADMGAFYFRQNQAPVIIREIADLVVDEDCGYRALAALDTLFVDPDGDTLGFTVEGAGELGLTITEEGVLGLEPALNFFGDSLIVSVYEYDAQDTTSFSLEVTVNPVNDAPMDFTLWLPESGATLVNGEIVRFRWHTSRDPDFENVDYRLQIADLDAGRPRWFWGFDSDTTWFDLSVDFNIGSFMWRVRAISGQDTVMSRSSNDFGVRDPDDVDLIKLNPVSFHFGPIYPNPFNALTTISFGFDKSAPTRLAVYDLSGRLVAELLEGNPPFNSPPASRGGNHSVVWNAEGLPGGIYLIRLEAGKQTQTMKVLLLK